MRFIYGPADFRNLTIASRNCCLLTNGLGGYLSVTAAFGVNRNDQGILIAAESAPNKRNNLLHRLKEQLCFEDKHPSVYLSSQEFADDTPDEDGFRHLTSLVVDDLPEWNYFYQGISVTRSCCMNEGYNEAAVIYDLTNDTSCDVHLKVTPMLSAMPKGTVREQAGKFTVSGSYQTGSNENRLHSARPQESCLQQSRLQGPDPDKTTYTSSESTANSVITVTLDGMALQTITDGTIRPEESCSELLYYAFDARDGRDEKGLACSCFSINLPVPAHSAKSFSVIFTAVSPESTDLLPVSGEGASGSFPARSEVGSAPIQKAGNVRAFSASIFASHRSRSASLLKLAGLKDPIARRLVLSSADFLSFKESTGGLTLLAGYPFFGDWGRDTMISLPGCVLATNRLDEARSILKTFLAYEKDGLVPNLFPEGNQPPMYNSVDAPLLLINGIWLYYEKSQDLDFVREAWPVLQRIILAYQKGTHYGIHMDNDGLISAGEGKYQLTWMDVCVNGFLPTPRHGKPVEINAYWYNALCIMEEFRKLLGDSSLAVPDYAAMASRTKASFLSSFWISGENRLKDLVSGTPADLQIRCNQIWALTLPFGMLTPEQEKGVVQNVYCHLYTPIGLRTLTPQDHDFHPAYGGSLYNRDTAYHQGTVWSFPLGAFYLACLKVYGNSKEAAARVRRMLLPMEAILREGCIGQIAEIYDGLYPNDSRGCFAQAWSVGELLRVYAKLEEIEGQTDL